MHKIERLLHTLAPKGVGFRKLGEVCEIIRGKRVTKKEILDKGKYPVVSGGIGFMGYLNEYNREENTITIAQYGTAGFVNWQNQKFWANDVCFSVIPKETLINRYLYYVLTNMQNYLYSISNRSAIPYSISSNNIMQITIPIPPLEIQQEIVTILDAFTELNTELNTELKARKKQYQYYQNMLLDFKDTKQSHKDANISAKTYPKRLKTLLQTLAPKGVGFRKLGEVLEYDQPNKYCVTSKEFDKSYPTPVLTAGKTFILGYTNEKDNIYQASKSSPVIIFDDFTTATQWVDFPFKVKSSAMKILLPKNPTINIRFIFFYMQTIPYNISGEHTRQWISRYSKITIPIPPLEIQQEIVKVLDQFLALTTDLLAGIPAEIKARKKQYEYYREKLLTFKPLTPHKEVKKG
ncbi:restriction endonuclease subunit S [Helicobacter pylori]|uniref:restriction endonuclease subunit S n=1 Tax=Helicobacter pylori TaxID=210 RepID=UPI0011C777F7|nr:restriction endonuclease subunit S [Helicobacter pylori]NHA80825.1 restriction endonuclease subunit S [Helicobacter pylori]QEF43386.1 restriction endonuclease subunit S [Helicobacter pylori]